MSEQDLTVLLARMEGKLDLLVFRINKAEEEDAAREARLVAVERKLYIVSGAMACLMFLITYGKALLSFLTQMGKGP